MQKINYFRIKSVIMATINNNKILKYIINSIFHIKVVIIHQLFIPYS